MERLKIWKANEWLLLVLASVPALLGPVLFGCTRIVYVLAVLLPLFTAAVLFFAQGIRFRQAIFPPAFGVFVLIIAYAAGLHMSAPLPYLSLVNIIQLLGWLFAYWIWSTHCRSWGRCRWLWGSLLVVLTGICWYAVWRHFHGNVGFEHDQNHVLLYGPSHYKMRASGTYICPNHFASVIVMGICVATGLLFIRSSGWVLKCLSAQYLVVALPCLLQSGSRSGWLGVLTGLGVLFALMLWKKSRVWCVVLMALFLCFMAAGAFLLYKYLPFIQERIASGSAGRLALWPGVIEMIKEKPVTGWGVWTFRYVFQPYKPFGTGAIMWRYAHNEYLHIAAETGLVGLGLTLVMIVTWYVRWILNYIRAASWRTTVVSAIALAAVSASLVHALFDFNLTTYANSQVLLLIAGCAAGVEFSGLRKREEAAPKRNIAVNAVGAIGSLVLLGVTLVFFMNQLYVFIGNRQLYIAKDYPAALESFDKAEGWYDGYWRTSYHKGVAHHRLMKKLGTPVPEILENWGQALADLTRSYELNPYFQAGVYELSEIFNHRMDYGMQTAFLREAISLDPQRAFYWQLYFRRLRRMDAMDEIKEACRLALNSGVLKEGQLWNLLRKEKIKGVDVKAIAEQVAENPQSVPRRVFREDSQAMVPLYSWQYGAGGGVTNVDHALLKK